MSEKGRAVYVELQVRLHGLNNEEHHSVENEVRRLLEPRFGQRMSDDVEVEVVEWAGPDVDPKATA